MAGKPAYSSAKYRNVAVRGKRCTWCGNMATTRDHEPALALHEHREGAACCVVVPACGPCNFAHGRLVAQAIRDAKRATRTGALAGRRTVDDVDVW